MPLFGPSDPRNPANQRATSQPTRFVNPETGSVAQSAPVSGTPGWASQSQPAGVVTGASDYATDSSKLAAGPASVAVEYDPLGGGFYYVRAESINGQAWLEQQRTSSAAPAPNVNDLANLGVPYVPVARPSIDNLFPEQQPLPGTKLDSSGPAGIVTGAGAPAAPAAPEPSSFARPAPRPASGAPSLRIRRSRGTGNAAFAAGSRNALDLGGFDSNPLSIRPQQR